MRLGHCVDDRKQIMPEEMPKLYAVLRQLANPTTSRDVPELKDQPEQVSPAPRKMTNSQRAVAAMVAQNGAVKLDAASPIVNDVIRRRSCAVRRHQGGLSRLLLC
jgi:hypothetical protein